MNKRLIILGSLFAAILLIVIGVMLFSLYSGPVERKKTEVKRDIYASLPADAVMLFDFNNFESLKYLLLHNNSSFSDIIDRDKELWKFINVLSDDIFSTSSLSHMLNNEVLMSVHPAGKNELALLYVNVISGHSKDMTIVEEIRKAAVISSTREYDGVTIYRLSNPEISIAFCNGCLLASTSLTTLESSIRHITNSSSLLDNTLFESLITKKTGELTMFVNHVMLSRLFPAMLNQNVLKQADFIASTATWSLINVKIGTNRVFLDGEFLLAKDGSNFASLFSTQKVRENMLFKVVPYNANYAISFVFSSAKEFQQAYKAYMEANKKGNAYKNRVAKVRRESSLDQDPELWLESLLLDEIGVVSISLGKQEEKVLLMKGKNISQLGGEEGMIFSFRHKGYIPAVLGDIFSTTNDEYFTIISDFAVIGSKECLEVYLNGLGENGFSLHQYLGQTTAFEQIRINSNMSMVVNLNRFSERIADLFNRNYSYQVREFTGNRNFEFGMLQIINEDRRIRLRGGVYMENLNQMPQPKNQRPEGTLPLEHQEDTIVVVPKGPFELKNFVDGNTNYLEQMPNLKLRLMDEKKRGVWTIPFSSPICGYVEQIDYFENGKLQMLFASESKIYLLDRLGRFVNRFPIDIGKEIVLGPKAFDFENRRNYSFMTLHNDNTVGLYNMKGEQIEGWHPITTEEKIKRLPEELIIGSNRYWILRTNYQTLIYHQDGTPVSEFTRKNQISPDTEIKVLSDKEVELTKFDNKTAILNLETGKLK